jgi:hypothetical protein
MISTHPPSTRQRAALLTADPILKEQHKDLVFSMTSSKRFLCVCIAFATTPHRELYLFEFPLHTSSYLISFLGRRIHTQKVASGIISETEFWSSRALELEKERARLLIVFQ